MAKFFSNPKHTRWVVMAICFALGLLVGWLSADFWLDKWSGINL